jgi:hypothetical protein
VIDSNENHHDIKKIIDPKSGFTLYLRKFKDTPISQVSSIETFPVPNPSTIPNLDCITSPINEIKTKTNLLSEQQAIMEKKIQTKLHQLMVLVVGLIGLCIFLIVR